MVLLVLLYRCTMLLPVRLQLLVLVVTELQGAPLQSSIVPLPLLQ
jgi:hypothetical protein